MEDDDDERPYLAMSREDPRILTSIVIHLWKRLLASMKAIGARLREGKPIGYGAGR